MAVAALLERSANLEAALYSAGGVFSPKTKNPKPGATFRAVRAACNRQVQSGRWVHLHLSSRFGDPRVNYRNFEICKMPHVSSCQAGVPR
jgi:hypothetical protein